MSKKPCKKCGKTLPLENFTFKVKARGIRHSNCAKCQAKMSNDHYYRNKKMYFANNKRKKEKIRELIREAKNGPCMDCGVQYPHYVLDFDHRDSTTKTLNLARAPGRLGFKSLALEIAKCDLVCANCHRVRTWTRKNSMDL